ncbi:MAG: bifunctional folylpolyglutamate synthase/dihydrofolate synthase [Bacillota bacterium]
MEELEYLQQLDKFGIKPGLERMNLLLDYLGNPEQDLKIIHIAGTNGKGSTSAILTAIYKEAGYKVGTYNSPEIVEFNERIRINDNYISAQRLAEVVQEVQRAVEKVAKRLEHPSFFEVVTAVAILYFAQEKVDLAILEVGMGGKLDATNIGQSLISVITNVSLDHTEYLGETLEEITREKAGIVKKDQPVVTAAVKPEVVEEIATIAHTQQAELINVNQCFKWERDGFDLAAQQFSIRGAQEKYEGLKLPLLGEYQIVNTAVAVAVVEQLQDDYPVVKNQIKEGLLKVNWPGRLEVVAANPTVILDGAHNHAGAKSLNRELSKLEYNNLIIILSILEDKDYQGILEQLAPLADKIVLSKNNNPRAAKVDKLQKYVKKYDQLDVIVEEDLELAVDNSLNNAVTEDLILIGGSLYTVAQIRGRWVK